MEAPFVRSFHFRFLTTCLLVLLCSMVSAQKRVSILGDSYSAYMGYVYPPDFDSYAYYYSWGGTTDVRYVEQMWWYQVIDHFDWVLERNCSLRGSFICNVGDGGEDFSSYSFTERMDELGNPDVILIAGGTNDAWRDSPMGDYKYENITTSDLRYFRPALAKVLSWTIAHYNAAVYFVLNSGLGNVVDESVIRICDHYGVGCIKLADGMDRQSDHPTIYGMKQISSQVISYIEAHPPVPTSIAAPFSEGNFQEEWYSLDGQRMNTPRKGINIMRTRDGKWKKQVVR